MCCPRGVIVCSWPQKHRLHIDLRPTLTTPDNIDDLVMFLSLGPAVLSHSYSRAKPLRSRYVACQIDGHLRDQWELHHTVKVTDTPEIRAAYPFGHVVGLARGSQHGAPLGRARSMKRAWAWHLHI